MGIWQQLKAIITLPVTSTIIIPTVILLLTFWFEVWWFSLFPLNLTVIVVGCGVIALGLLLVIKTNLIFAKIGKGTLAPWDPPKNFVISGIYRYVRNPMIIGVAIILSGEALLFGSLVTFIWVICFLVGNHVYFIKKEEPGLETRFGSKYLLYKKNVPRWIPRLKPWTEVE